MGFIDWFTSSTPGGIAGEAGQKIVGGIFSGVKDLIEEFHLSPEQAQQFKMKLAELELQSYQAQISDIQSARQMQMATRSMWPGTLTLVIIGGYFTLIGLMIFHGIPSTTQPGGEVLLTLMGVLTTAVPMVLAYWFGLNSQMKDQARLLAESIPVSKVATISDQK